MQSSSKSQLFWRVSALALMSTAGATGAKAADKGGLTLEIDGTYEFDETPATQSFVPSEGIPNAMIRAHHGYDAGGRLTWQPANSDLSFGLAAHFGRTTKVSHAFSYSYYSKYPVHFNQQVQHSYSIAHTVVDFEVGKDVGIGLFGGGSTTTIGGGVRYGHFNARTRGSFSTSAKYFGGGSVNRAGGFRIARSTDAAGPRIFVRTTSSLPGEMGHKGFSIGLGVDGSVLFGRQKATDTVDIAYGGYTGQFPNFRRSRTKTVPTVGAFGQVNWAVPGNPLTVSLGYKVDDYFGAVDGGFAGSHSIDILEHGPFVSLTWKLQ